MEAIVRANLLKTSTNLLVISVSWLPVAEKIRLGLRIDAFRSQSSKDRTAGPPAGLRRPRLGPNTATLEGPGSSPEGGRGKADSERRPMLGAPLGAGAAHVMQFRPVVIAQPAREGAEQAGEAGQGAPGPAPMAERSTGGGHDLVRAALCPRSFLVGDGTDSNVQRACLKHW